MAEMPSLETMRSRGSHRPRSLEAAFVYVKEARRRLARDPSDADALFALVMWFAILGQPAMSIGLLDRLTRMDLEYPGVWSLKAYVYRQVGNEKMAALCERAASRSEV